MLGNQHQLPIWPIVPHVTKLLRWVARYDRFSMWHTLSRSTGSVKVTTNPNRKPGLVERCARDEGSRGQKRVEVGFSGSRSRMEADLLGPAGIWVLFPSSSHRQL